MVSWPFRKPTRLQGPGSVIAFPSPESHAPRAGSFRKARPERTGLRSPRPGAKAQRSHQRPGPLLGSGAGGVTSRGRCRRSRVLGQAAPGFPAPGAVGPSTLPWPARPPPSPRTARPAPTHAPQPRSRAQRPPPCSHLAPSLRRRSGLGPGAPPAACQTLRPASPGSPSRDTSMHRLYPPPNLQEVRATPALQGLPPTQ